MRRLPWPAYVLFPISIVALMGADSCGTEAPLGIGQPDAGAPPIDASHIYGGEDAGPRAIDAGSPTPIDASIPLVTHISIDAAWATDNAPLVAVSFFDEDPWPLEGPPPGESPDALETFGDCGVFASRGGEGEPAPIGLDVGPDVVRLAIADEPLRAVAFGPGNTYLLRTSSAAPYVLPEGPVRARVEIRLPGMPVIERELTIRHPSIEAPVLVPPPLEERAWNNLFRATLPADGDVAFSWNASGIDASAHLDLLWVAGGDPEASLPHVLACRTSIGTGTVIVPADIIGDHGLLRGGELIAPFFSIGVGGLESEETVDEVRVRTSVRTGWTVRELSTSGG
jgi:hypothetical protein